MALYAVSDLHIWGPEDPLYRSLLTDPDARALVSRARATYARRTAAMADALAARGIDVPGRDGINVWVPVADETSAVARLRDAGWGVAPGAANRLASGPALRITISGLDEPDLAPLADGMLAGDQVVCPYHAYRYDGRTGECDQAGACSVTTYPARVTGGKVEVTLTYRPQTISLVVEDFQSATPAPPVTGGTDGGYGLTGMRERAELLGGTLVAAPTKGGFRVELRVPA